MSNGILGLTRGFFGTVSEPLPGVWYLTRDGVPMSVILLHNEPLDPVLLLSRTLENTRGGLDVLFPDPVRTVRVRLECPRNIGDQILL